MEQNGKSLDMRQNPLYPDRVESNAMGVLLAIVSVIVAIILLVVIVMNFSYAAHPERLYGDSGAAAYEEEAMYEEEMPYTEEPAVEQFTGEDGISGEEMTGTDAAVVAEEDADLAGNEEFQAEQSAEDAVAAAAGLEADGTALAGETDYILPESDVRYLERSDLENLTAQQLRLARNEIYARHGRLFDDEQLQEYFNSKPWYSGTIPAADFTESMLNDYERENTYIITDFEKEMGYR